jgi:hypothetical protein
VDGSIEQLVSQSMSRRTEPLFLGVSVPLGRLRDIHAFGPGIGLGRVSGEPRSAWPRLVMIVAVPFDPLVEPVQEGLHGIARLQPVKEFGDVRGHVHTTIFPSRDLEQKTSVARQVPDGPGRVSCRRPVTCPVSRVHSHSQLVVAS